MKEVYKIVLPIFILILTSCSSIQWRPVYLPSTPQNTYNKKLVSFSAGGLFSEGNSLNVSLGYQNRDLFFSAQYYQTYASKYESYVYQTYTSEYYESYGLGIYAIKNFWLKVDKYEYPWANFFVGVQPLLVHFLYKKEYKIYFYKEEYEDYYFPIELNIGFRPGIYRDNYNLNFTLRGGVGTTIPSGNYLSGGIGVQGNVFTGNFGLGLNTEFVIGLGGIQFNENRGATLAGTSPIISLYLLFSF
jgi:hypothetical protein